MQILEPLTFLFISLLKLIRKCKNGAFSRKKQLKNHKPTEIPSSGRKKKINMPKKWRDQQPLTWIHQERCHVNAISFCDKLAVLVDKEDAEAVHAGVHRGSITLHSESSSANQRCWKHCRVDTKMVRGLLFGDKTRLTTAFAKIGCEDVLNGFLLRSDWDVVDINTPAIRQVINRWHQLGKGHTLQAKTLDKLRKCSGEGDKQREKGQVSRLRCFHGPGPRPGGAAQNRPRNRYGSGNTPRGLGGPGRARPERRSQAAHKDNDRRAKACELRPPRGAGAGPATAWRQPATAPLRPAADGGRQGTSFRRGARRRRLAVLRPAAAARPWRWGRCRCSSPACPCSPSST